jgi:hypothetical protein
MLPLEALAKGGLLYLRCLVGDWKCSRTVIGYGPFALESSGRLIGLVDRLIVPEGAMARTDGGVARRLDLSGEKSVIAEMMLAQSKQKPLQPPGRPSNTA